MLATLDHLFRVAFVEEKDVLYRTTNCREFGNRLRISHALTKYKMKTVEVDGELLLNSAQFDFFLKQRESVFWEYQKYLDEPIPEDIDIKDED